MKTSNENSAHGYTEGSEVPMDKAMHSEFEGHTKTPEWYNENQMYHWLIRENYSENIAKELSFKWAKDLQGAFNKGFEKGTKENQSLRSELQKQKELNAELVAYVDDLLEDHKNCPWMIDNGHRAESLIKKSKPT